MSQRSQDNGRNAALEVTFYGPIIARWEIDLRGSKTLRNDTIEKKARMMKHAADFGQANGWPEDPAEITDEQVQAYHISLASRSYPTRMFHLSNLKQFVAWAKEKAEASGEE